MQAPLPPPSWTAQPITLSIPPSCKACTRELQHLAYTERITTKKLTHAAHHQPASSRRHLLNHRSSSNVNVNHIRDGENFLDGSASRKVSLGGGAKHLFGNNTEGKGRKISLGMKYPPLPKWMVRPQHQLPRPRSSAHVTTQPAQKSAKPKEVQVDRPFFALTNASSEDVDDDDDDDNDEEKKPPNLPKWMDKLPRNRKGWRMVSEKQRIDSAGPAGLGVRGISKASGRRVVSGGGGAGRFLGGRVVVV